MLAVHPCRNKRRMVAVVLALSLTPGHFHFREIWSTCSWCWNTWGLVFCPDYTLLRSTARST